MDYKKFIFELETYIELKELRDIGFSEEEIAGFIELNSDSWFSNGAKSKIK